MAATSATIEDAARRACRYFYDELRSGQAERACALVRCYKTHQFSDLPADLRDTGGRKYGVFHVEEARGSPYIPAQAEFVDTYGRRSIVGFGGTLASGDLFAVILFSRVPIDATTADRFRAIALDVKGGLFSFTQQQVFDGPRPTPRLDAGPTPRGPEIAAEGRAEPPLP